MRHSSTKFGRNWYSTFRAVMVRNNILQKKKIDIFLKVERDQKQKCSCSFIVWNNWGLFVCLLFWEYFVVLKIRRIWFKYDVMTLGDDSNHKAILASFAVLSTQPPILLLAYLLELPMLHGFTYVTCWQVRVKISSAATEVNKYKSCLLCFLGRHQ